jgi:hypothetical protein
MNKCEAALLCAVVHPAFAEWIAKSAKRCQRFASRLFLIMTLVVKVYFGNDIRRQTLDLEPALGFEYVGMLDRVRTVVEGMYGLRRVRLCYNDGEDKVSLTSDADFVEAMKFSAKTANGPLLRIYVEACEELTQQFMHTFGVIVRTDSVKAALEFAARTRAIDVSSPREVSV